MKTYNKLIRDKIPQIIDNSGSDFAIALYSESEYILALKQKLIEEAQEIAIAQDDELISELADLLEVFDSLLEVKGISREAVVREQELRREERGGFRDRIKLLWTEKKR
jgi:predicted house-cleaning noncanonical NTP pyrophosphatase (MazG superfamily)